MAWETEKRKLDSERVTKGVAALLNDSTKGTYFVAEVETGGRQIIAGQLLITYEWSDWRNGNFWWIQSVYVVEEVRGGGVFKALLLGFSGDGCRSVAVQGGECPNSSLSVLGRWKGVLIQANALLQRKCKRPQWG